MFAECEHTAYDSHQNICPNYSGCPDYIHYNLTTGKKKELKKIIFLHFILIFEI